MAEAIAGIKKAKNYDYKLLGKDPHIPAAIMKQWLRELPIPLFQVDGFLPSSCCSHFFCTGLLQMYGNCGDEFGNARVCRVAERSGEFAFSSASGLCNVFN